MKKLLTVALLASICFSAGCASTGKRTFQGKATKGASRISKEELRQSLDQFEEYAIATITEATDQIDEKKLNFRLRKLNLLQRTRLGHAYHTMNEHQDPVVAFLETWGLCVRLTNYFKYGEGRGLFGEHQEIALTASEKLEAEIERIGKRISKEDAFIETRKRVHQFAKTNPMRGTFSNTIVYATEVAPGEPGLFDDVINIPLSPFKAMSGVDRTASAIYGMRDSVNRISDVVYDFPESTRWQLLLLLMEMEETELVKTFLESMSKLSDSSVRLTDTAEKLPEQLRKEISILIEDINDKQASLHTTLEEAQKTFVVVDQALVQAGKTAEAFKSTAVDVSETAAAWEKAATATTEALAGVSNLKKSDKDTEPAEPKRPFDIKEYHDTIEAAGRTVIEMRELTAEIHKLLESEKVYNYASVPDNFVNLLTWRLVQLVVLIFVLALVYRIIIVRGLLKPKQKG
ncbi:MAG: hypothetical protein ACYS67_12150 [Planctomycetota bacterium]|jgi:hypothetical protein